MFENIEAFYQEKTAQTLQLALKAKQLLLIVIISFYDLKRENLNYVLNNSISFLSKKNVKILYKIARK